MFEKALSFFRQTRALQRIAPRDWLNLQLKTSGLEARFPPAERHITQGSARVFFNKQYFAPTVEEVPFSLNRVLRRIPAVSVSGDRGGVFPNGLLFPDDLTYFSRIPTTHPELLSPLERLTGAKKIVFSKSTVFASGGYPVTNPVQLYKDSLSVGIFSVAAATFENTYLHYRLFMLDPVNHTIDNTQFAHLYANLPTSFREAQSTLGSYDVSQTLMRIRTGFPYLARSSNDNFHSSFLRTKGVIFLSEAYFRHQLEDISLLLTAVNETAKESGKPALLKATAAGMGFFAKINGTYDIQHILYPYYLRAYKKLLSEHSYPWIAKIEFPTFTEQQEEQFDGIMDKLPGNVTVYQSSRDVLDFTEVEVENHFISVINPSDCFSYAGNEWGYSSVESMIGLNTSLRVDQIPLENPLILDPAHHVAVSVNSENFGAEIIESAPISLKL